MPVRAAQEDRVLRMLAIKQRVTNYLMTFVRLKVTQVTDCTNSQKLWDVQNV